MHTVSKLLDAIRGGDRGAFELVIEPELAALRSQAAGFVDDALRAHVSPDDLLQETRLLAYRHLTDEGVADDAALRAWLARILERVSLNTRRRYLKTKKRGGDVLSLSLRGPTPSGGSQPCLDVPGSATSPSQGAARSESIERLRQVMDLLPADARNVILMVRFDGKSFAEAAAALGRTEAATRKLLSRAVAQLGDMLRGNQT